MDGLFGDDLVEEVITDEERERLRNADVEHHIEEAAQKIFRAWVARWYEGRYTQNKGHIVKVIKDALRDGLDYQLVNQSMTYLGSQAQVVTRLSLQVAISQVERYRSTQGFDYDSLGVSENNQDNYTEGFSADENSNNSAQQFNNDDYRESI